MLRKSLAIATIAVIALVILFWVLGKDEAEEAHTSEVANPSELPAGEASTDTGSKGALRAARLGAEPGVTSGTIQGRVFRAPDGEAVPWVDIVFRTGRQESSVSSDEKGRYTIELGPGRYEVRAVGADVIAHALPPLQVGHTAEITLDIPVTALGRVRGRVVSPDRVGIGGVEISLRTDVAAGKDYPNEGEIGQAESESDGAFEVRVPPGEAALEVRLADTTVFANVAKVPAGGTIEGVEIVLDQRGQIFGSVFLPDGAVASGARVLLTQRRTGTSHFVHREIQTDGAGQFVLDDLTPTEYALEAILEGYGSSDPILLTLQAEHPEIAVEMSLHKPQRLAGRVVSSAGRPLDGVRVSQVRQDSRQYYNKMNTGLDGSFDFVQVSPGPHRLHASKEGYATQIVRDVAATKLDVEIALQLAGSLRGIVTSEEGNPVKKFSVALHRKGTKKTKQKTSHFVSKDGSYDLYPVDPGSYQVTVSAPGFAPQVIHALAIPEGEAGRGDVKLRASGSGDEAE